MSYAESILASWLSKFGHDDMGLVATVNLERLCLIVSFISAPKNN